jgi:hypothetical protein
VIAGGAVAAPVAASTAADTGLFPAGALRWASDRHPPPVGKTIHNAGRRAGRPLTLAVIHKVNGKGSQENSAE